METGDAEGRTGDAGKLVKKPLNRVSRAFGPRPTPFPMTGGDIYFFPV